MSKKKLSSLVPSNWCDPLLTGPGVPPLPWNCPEIEHLLREVRRRIEEAEARSSKKPSRRRSPAGRRK